MVVLKTDGAISFPLDRLRPEVRDLASKLQNFVREFCEPAEVAYENHMAGRSGRERWVLDAVSPCIEELKRVAQSLGLWNLFLTVHNRIPDTLLKSLHPSVATRIVPSMYLTTEEYGILCEIMGRSFLTPEACNCSAPDTGNMEVLLKHGSLEQQQRYLVPLLEGKIRSCFLMTEPDVSSSDALNIQSRLTKLPSTMEHGTTEVKYILNGRKWWSTGAMDPRCEVALVLAKLEPSPSSSTTTSLAHQHQQHTVVIVPMKSKGVSLVSKITINPILISLL